MKNISILLLILTNVTICSAQEPKILFFKAIEQNDTLLVAKLINDGFNPNTIQANGWVKISPLIHAVLNRKLRVCEQLINSGAEINWQDGFKTSALMYAASDGQEQLVELLINHRADVFLKDNQGNDALSAANESKNSKIIDLITQARHKKR